MFWSISRRWLIQIYFSDCKVFQTALHWQNFGDILWMRCVHYVQVFPFTIIIFFFLVSTYSSLLIMLTPNLMFAMSFYLLDFCTIKASCKLVKSALLFQYQIEAVSLLLFANVLEKNRNQESPIFLFLICTSILSNICCIIY